MAKLRPSLQTVPSRRIYTEMLTVVPGHLGHLGGQTNDWLSIFVCPLGPMGSGVQARRPVASRPDEHLWLGCGADCVQADSLPGERIEKAKWKRELRLRLRAEKWPIKVEKN